MAHLINSPLMVKRHANTAPFLCLSSPFLDIFLNYKSPHQKSEANFDGLMTMNFHGALALQLLFGPKIQEFG